MSIGANNGDFAGGGAALLTRACAKSVSKFTPPFALSWSKGHPFLVRPAHHERTLN